MALRKKLKNWGDSVVLTFTKEDLELYNLKEGDVIDISDFVRIEVGKC